MRTPEVYELIQQLQYFYEIADSVRRNLENIETNLHPDKQLALRRFIKLKEQMDGHIADIIDDLQHAKNGALS